MPIKIDIHLPDTTRTTATIWAPTPESSMKTDSSKVFLCPKAAHRRGDRKPRYGRRDQQKQNLIDEPDFPVERHGYFEIFIESNSFGIWMDLNSKSN
jgi:hypothetical protein